MITFSHGHLWSACHGSWATDELSFHLDDKHKTGAYCQPIV